jgi:hypothetical protein
MAPNISARTARTAGSLLVVGAAAAALAGCGNGVPTRLEFSDTEKVKISEIVVSGRSGNVTVSRSSTAETKIHRVVEYRGAEPTAAYTVTGSVLAIDTSCGSNCWVSYEIETPAGVAVKGELGSGDLNLSDVSTADVTVTSGNVEVSAASGAVSVQARSGNIIVRDLLGATELIATSGNIDGTGLGAAALTVEARSGNIDLALSKAGPVTAKATSGNVRVAVPDGSYQVRSSARNGWEEIEIPHDAASKNLLDISTASGNVEIIRG